MGVIRRRDPLDRELRREDGARQHLRVMRLAEVLDERPIPVAHEVRRWFGERVSLWLDNGVRLRLWLLWGCPGVVATVLRIRWVDEIGWAVTVRLADGQPTLLYAWRLTVTPTGPDGLSGLRRVRTG